MSKIMVAIESHKRRHSMANASCMFDKQGCMHAPAYTHARTRAPTHTYARAHRRICNTYCFSTAIITREWASDVTFYVHCLSCFSLLVDDEWFCKQATLPSCVSSFVQQHTGLPHLLDCRHLLVCSVADFIEPQPVTHAQYIL
jgi:hypothetical protein